VSTPHALAWAAGDTTRLNTPARRAMGQGFDTLEVLGKRLTFRVDPGGLNEAGVVWGAAVKALAAAVAPTLRRR